MLPPNPADKLNAAPVTDLIELLLKQFRRILADRQIDLASDDMRAIAEAAAAHRPLPPLAERVMPALIDAVDESQALLRERFGLSFGDSLAADMQTIGGWQTTADFLDIANEKSNAELRITAPDEPEARAAYARAHPGQSRARAALLANLVPIAELFDEPDEDADADPDLADTDDGEEDDA